MKMSHFLSFLGGALLVLGVSSVSQSNAQSQGGVYELRMYHVNPGKMDALKARFGDHTDGIFKRHGIKPIGYWVAQDAPNAKNLFIYIVQHASRAQADKNWNAFVADPEWPKVRAASEVNGVLVEEKNIDRFFMDPTSYSPLK